MSRTPTMSAEKLAQLQVNHSTSNTQYIAMRISLKMANVEPFRDIIYPFKISIHSQGIVLDLGLNPHNLEYNEGSQEGCW